MARKKNSSTSSERSWRDLKQNVASSPLTKIAREKYWRRLGKNLSISLFVLAIVGATYFSSIYFLENRDQLSLELPSAKLKEVRYETNGVVNENWLGRQLNLREEAMMSELDVGLLRDRILKDPQVKDVIVKKVFPDILDIEITEYVPVARIRLLVDSGKAKDFFVAENGYSFSGYGYTHTEIESLPYLQNFSLEERSMKTFVRGMEVVSELLYLVQLKLPQAYESWRTIDLSSFDGRAGKPWNFIKVYSDQIDLIVFGSDQFDKQIERLETVLGEINGNDSTRLTSLNLSLSEDLIATISSSQRL